MKATDNLALASYNILREYCRQHPYSVAIRNCKGCIFADEQKGCLVDGHLMNICPQDWPELEVVE